MTTVRALSLWQPWASLAAAGVKRVETRSWAPHSDLIGARLAIAATASLPKDAKDALRHGAEHQAALFDAIRAIGHEVAWDRKKLLHDLPLGRVLATVRVTGSYPMVDPDGQLPERCLVVTDRRLLIVRPEGDLDVSDQRPFGEFAAGRVGWLLEDPVPVVGDHPARGAQGIWNWRPAGPYQVVQ